MGRVTVRPVTPENWADFETLFGAKGAPHHCWCTPHRFRDHADLTPEVKKQRMHALVDSGTPIGVLAYERGAPVGWCSVAPRETFAVLERSRTMARATPPEVSTWTVLCFFVPRANRAQGVTRALLKGAATWARKRGARVLEGYPFDTAGVSSMHRGHSSVFERAGFEQEGNRWWREL